ncbi:MAG: nickel pincer cofactor biosynthesis protein LarC [Actinobacteria bacterium]|nr:nickel pincer cofactor biosynthesis protein LarC [Actinomycetota bacterium]
MSRLAYVDAIGGLAGDMLLGALLDAGADPDRVRDGLRRLGPPGLDLVTAVEHRQGIAACRVVAVVGEDAGPDAPRRTWADVRVLLDAAELPPRVRTRARAVFAALARAEGRVHGVAPETVHFHEVGALDAIGDVCGIVLALEDLGVDELAFSSVPVATGGLVDSAHGRLPLPAPATLELLRGAPLHGVPGSVELVTPTGAAVVGALAVEFGPLPAMRLESVGYGAGARDLADRPNLVRVLVGQRLAAEGAGLGAGGGQEEAVLIETNLDDLSPELVPDAAERCFAAGALDVWVVPAQMKKGRPGVVFSALARPGDEEAVARAMLRETSALGLRVTPARRWELERRWTAVEVAPGEAVRVKLGSLDGRTVNAAPEHDDCLAVARRTGRPVKAIWAAALAGAADAYERAGADAGGTADRPVPEPAPGPAAPTAAVGER